MPFPSHIHFRCEEALVERGVVGDADVVAEEGPQAGHDALWRWLAPDHGVRDAGEAGDERGILKPGSINSEKVATTAPSSTMTAATSMMRSSPARSPVVSKSMTASCLMDCRLRRGQNAGTCPCACLSAIGLGLPEFGDAPRSQILDPHERLQEELLITSA
jgi:hypothetical protein